MFSLTPGMAIVLPDLEDEDEYEGLDGGDVGEDAVDRPQQADKAAVHHHSCTVHRVHCVHNKAPTLLP